ncbi:hypothetical protein A0256_19650 [Mucilaginibacter sp. PAMC 26640]|nr:hypothetical protein A0256_19650 [Mucilaginibacter sp. PAMC 26640]
MHTTVTNDLGLVVPVDIAALCVGIIDQNDKKGTNSFAGATTVYTNQAGKNQAYVGTNVVRALSAAPWQQLTTGIHLHWNLPETLTNGTNNKAGLLVFNSVPNRWLISRVVITATGPVRSSWVVESDALNMSLPKGQLAITLPVKKVKATDQDYMYNGTYKVFDAQWTDPGNNDNFKNLTGQDLTAVSSGDSSFAAFYPNSRSVFGFQDKLEDIKITANDPPVDIMYEVTGWFSNPANDPLKGGKTKEQVNNDLNWTYTGDSVVTNYSVYSGLVQNVLWNPYNKYIVDQANQLPINAKLTIGNTPPESFAAYFKNQLHPDIAFFETLLNAFQNGLLSEFMQPKPDQLAQLQQVLHQKTFADYSSGTIYQIVRPEKDSPEETEVELPLPLAESLNLLNLYQQELDFYINYTGRFQWQLFADWYKLVNTTDPSIQNNLYQIIYQNLGIVWPEVQATNKTLSDQLSAQKTIVKGQIQTFDAMLELKPTAPARYWQPNEPVVLLVPEHMSNAIRSKALKQNYDANGYLPCRTTQQLITQVVVNSVTVAATQFASAELPSPNHLPYPDVTNQLLEESYLLNSQLGSALTGVSANDLEKALNAAMAGKEQSVYTFTGVVPSAIEVSWWHSNPWYPVFTEWIVKYYPLEATEANGQLLNYNPDLFYNNYAIDQSNGGSVVYTGTLDPSTIDFSKAQQYKSSAVLSNSAAKTFRTQLEDYLNVYPNETLQFIADELAVGLFASAPLSGMNSLLAMQQQSMQLNIAVTPQNPYYSITQLVAQVSAGANKVSPVPNGYFNPIRAGFLEFSISVVDVYGQKRTVNITETITSVQVTSLFKGSIVPNVVYVPPAMAQPTRLLFRWLAAIGDEIQEMNAHPSTTPICGWFLPNHLNGSLFIYDQQGRSMGTLGMNGNETAMVWQSAPGNNATINESVEEVFALQNPNLRDMAVALYNNGPAFFTQFWKAIDNMHNFIDPANYAQSSDLAVLIGRPVALGEVMLRLEVDGGPAMNQSWTTITTDNYRTDNKFTDVRFPVILGDMNQINDGLIGYFLDKDNAFDFSTFYTEGAPATNTSGVIRPAENTIELAVSPKPDSAKPYDSQANAEFVLMLFDPRATIHASTGILPTKSIDIPSELYADTLGILEMTFLTTPVLKGVTGFNMPLPEEEGYQWSWVEETFINDEPAWAINPDVKYIEGQAIGDYTPQTIREGWLRLNPQLLRFEMLNDRQQASAPANTLTTLYLVVTNRKPATIKFIPGVFPLLGAQNTGSLLYFHLGGLVDQAKVSAIQPMADGWQFRAMNTQRYGNYWAATPVNEVSLLPDDSFTITLANLQTSGQTGQIQMYFDYLNITSLNDGIDAPLITLTN